MSDFNTFEPMFQKTYKLVFKYLNNNLIDVLDEHAWMGWVYWVQLLVYILAVASHTGGVLDLMAEGADLVKLSTDLSVTLVLCQATFVFLQMQMNRKLIKNLILHLGNEWRRDEDLKPEMIEFKRKTVDTTHMWIGKFYKVLRNFIHLYVCLPLLFMAVKHFILKMDPPLITSFKIKVPCKYDDNFLLFFIFYMADYGVLYNTGFIITSDLLLLTVNMNHLRILFVILQDDLKSIAHSSDELEKSKSRLKKIIPKHDTLLRMMEEISEAYGALFLIHLFFFSGTVCFFGYAARVHCSPESIKNLLASSFILICIFASCSYGQDLTDASLDIADAAYVGPWYNMPREFQISILLIMIRSQKVYYIKSTSYADISLQSFTKILNVTWSFLSLIDKVYEG